MSKPKVSEKKRVREKAPVKKLSLPVQEKKAQEGIAPVMQQQDTASPTTDGFKPASLDDIQCELESLLFSAGKSMSEEKLAELTKRDPKQITQALKKLQQEYAGRGSSLAVFEEAGNWKINVKEKYLRLVRKIVADIEVSKSLLKTLAAIAWKSPVLQSEIIRIRSNKGYDHILGLEEMGFIVKEKKGRSFIIKTTQKFADYFEVDNKGSIKTAFQNVHVPQQTTLQEMPQPEQPTEFIPQTIPVERTIDREFLDRIDKKIEDVAKRNAETELPKRQEKEAQEENSPNI
ncbi:MAG: SMC-Scp complex subunit ScpB [archaeon]